MTITDLQHNYQNNTENNTLKVSPELEKKMRLLANILIDRFLEDRKKGLLQPDGIPYNVVSTVTI